MPRLIAVCALTAITAFIAAAQSTDKVDFRRDIRPLFQENCIGCHGPTQQMGGMRLDRRSSAMAIRGGTTIGPGNAQGSILYNKLIGTRYGGQMPPTGPLNPEQVRLVKDWIDQGAVWPDDLAGEKPPTAPDPKAAKIMNALRAGDRPAFARLLRDDPGVAKQKGPGGSTPLMYAALYGDASSVRELIEHGADVNAANDADASALMWAIDDLEKSRLLLEHGANPNAISIDNRTPLIIALSNHNSTAIVKLLLDHGAKLAGKGPRGGNGLAPAGGDEALLRVLLDHGVERAQLSGGFLSALTSDCAACVDLLLPSVRKPQLSSLLASRAGSRDASALKFLLAHGADAKTAAPGLGFTSLMYAADAEVGAVEQVRLLLAHGADVNAKTADGATALDFAARSGNAPVVEVLKKAGAKPGDAPPPPSLKASPAASARAAVDRGIPLLQRSDVAFMKKSGCVSCHNNNLTAMTMTAARKQGVRIDDGVAHAQVKAIAAYMEANRERYLQGIAIAGGPDTASYILLGMAAEGWPSDPATDAVARYLKGRQRADGAWPTFGGRPPIESSDLQNTATVLRAVQVYMPKPQRAEYEESIQRAAGWIAKQQPVTNEDCVFQILGLQWSGRRDAANRFARDLLKEQRPDGGWSQTPLLPSDAYATGQALVALKEAGALAVSDAGYKRAAKFLMDTQMADGSWYVRSRTIPFQPYFDAGFPYGPDQFISAAATNWATMALIPLAQP